MDRRREAEMVARALGKPMPAYTPGRRSPPMGRQARERQLAEEAKLRAAQRQPYQRDAAPARRQQQPDTNVSSTTAATAAQVDVKAKAQAEVEEDEAELDEGSEPLTGKDVHAARRLRRAETDEYRAAQVEQSKAEKAASAARLAEARTHQHKAKRTDDSAARRIELPSTIVAGNLSRLLNVRISKLQRAIETVGLSDTRTDRCASAV